MANNLMFKTMYRQLYRRCHKVDQLFLSNTQLLPRRELSRFSFHIPPHLLDNSDQKLAEKAMEGKLFTTTLRQSFETTTATLPLDHMFGALRILNRRIEQLESSNFIGKPKRVKYDVGQIFRHKKWGFQGVIIGWFEVCPGDTNWAKTYGPFEDGLSQPFYRCLIDKNDRPPNGFVSIAAQENLIAVEPKEELEGVENDHLQNFFLSNSVEYGRHVLLEDVMKDFPDN